MNEVLINGFNIVDSNQSPEEVVLPEEFDACLVIWEEGWWTFYIGRYCSVEKS